MTSLTLGPLTSTRSFDKRYNLTRIQTGPLDYLYARNNLGQITRISGVDIPANVSELINYDYLSASNRLIDENGNSYTYDSNGNITSDGINTFTYDQSNRLVEVQQNGAPIAYYSYNPANQRIVKTTGTSTVFYHYDTSGKLISETDGIGTPLRDYIYLNNEPLAVKIYTDTPGTYYFLNDHLGTPQKLVNSSGTVVWQAVYLHYGKALVTVDTITNNLRFPGQYFDSETGLHYNWNRYYDPSIGRYISADPIGLAGGMNLYSYVSGNPINAVDPAGLAWKVGGGFGATLGIVHGSYSISTESCCDDDGKKHVRTIESVCWGMRLGVSINAGNTGSGSSSASLGGKKPGKCKGEGEAGPGSTFMTENNDKVFSSGVVVGAAWSPQDPTKTTITVGELGFGLTLSSKCWNSVIKDEVVGCCDE